MTSQIENDDLFDENEENILGKKRRKKPAIELDSQAINLDDDFLDDPFEERSTKKLKKPINELDSQAINLDDDFLDNPFEERSTKKLKKPINVVPLGARNRDSRLKDEQDEESIRIALLSFSQRIADERNAHNFEEEGQRLGPRNSFEEFLLSCRCELYEYDDGFYFFLSDNGTHAELIKTFDGVFSNDQKRLRILKTLEEAFEDRECFPTLLSPIHTAFGLQDTIIRALLLTSSIQTKVFTLLLKAIDRLSENSDSTNERLGLACVAQLRYLDFVVDSKRISKAIVEQDLTAWRMSVRDGFLAALPEVIADPISQEEIALHLQALLIERTSISSRSSRHSALSSLLLLRSDSTVAEEISSSLINAIESFDASSVLLIVELALKSSELNKNGLLRTLNRLKENLRVESLKTSKEDSMRTSLDETICELFMRFPKFMRLTGTNGWKQVLNFYKASTSKQNHENHEEISIIDEISAENEIVNSAAFNLFEILLAFSLLSEETCPPAIEQSLKQQAINPEKSSTFKATLLNAFNYKKFIAKNQDGILRLASRFFWTNDDSVRGIGGLIYTGLIQSLNAKHSKIVFKRLLSHLEGTSAEASTCLSALEALMKTSFQVLASHTDELRECLNKLSFLTIDSCIRLYRLFVFIYTKGAQQKLKQEVCDSIDHFSKSTDSRLQLWALLGLIAQFEATFSSENSDRETAMKQLLKAIDEISQKDPHLRATWFLSMAKILKENRKISVPKQLLEWTMRLIEEFQKDFFKDRGNNYNGQSELEGEEYRLKSKIWIVVKREEWPIFVPMLEMLQEFLHAEERCLKKNENCSKMIDAKILDLIFDANFAIKQHCDVEEMSIPEVKTAADVLFYTIHALTTILNNFGSSCNEKSAILHKKYRLLIACQSLLSAYISNITEWEVPKASFEQKKTQVTEKKAKKRVKQSGKKGGKRKRNIEDQEIPSAFDLEEENVENEEENEENETEKPNAMPGIHTTILSLNKMHTLFPSLKLALLVKLLEIDSLSSETRESVLLLLIDIVRIALPKKERRNSPFNNSSTKIDPFYHGEPSKIWKFMMKSIPSIIKTIADIRNILKEECDETGMVERGAQHSKRVKLLLVSLQILNTLLECKKAQRNVRNGEKREELLRIIENATIEYLNIRLNSSQNLGNSITCKLVIELCEVCPSLEVAVILSELANNISDESTDGQREVLGLHLLSFLRREWVDIDYKPLKAVQLNASVFILFQKYISIREKAHRLAALEWLTLVKIAQVLSRHTNRQVTNSIDDPLIKEQYNNTPFGCINKTTFTGVYRAALSSLNECVNESWAKSNMLSSRISTPTECIEKWAQAAGIFAALAAMLEHKSLRSTAMLIAFAREGRKFVLSFIKNSSFFEAFEKLKVSEKAHRTLKAMQVGSRHLQQISIYAKQHKSPILLRALPELRACGESFLRTVRSIMVKIGCEETMVFGLLVARDIDGEKIVSDEAEDGNEDGNEVPTPGETNNEETSEVNDEDSRTSEVY